MQESGSSQRPTSPIHIHVDDLTPVHVHVRKQKKSKPIQNKADRGQLMDKSTMALDETSPPVPSQANFGPRHTGAGLRSRSRSPQHLGPWIPPPAKSTKGLKYAWMTPVLKPDIPSAPLKKGEGDGDGDLDTEDEERVLTKVRQYERTIDELMREVGSLKKDAALQKSQREVEKKEEVLSASVKRLENREQEPNEMMRNAETNAQNPSSNHLTPKSDRVTLMKRLIEVEIDGQAVAAEFDHLREAVKKQRDSNVLGHLREKFHEKLIVFESSNRSLRHLLRDLQESESAVLRLNEHRDLLQEQLSHAESALMSLETQLCQERAEAEHLHEMLFKAKARVDQDKEALKKATRAQKDRASQKETALGMANVEIMEHQTIIHDLQADVTALRSKCERLSLDEKRATDEISRLNVQISEMEGVFERMATDSKRSLASTTSVLHERTSDLSSCKLENEQLKTSLSICEERLSHSQKEMSRMNEMIRDYELRMDQYCSEVQSGLRSRLDELAPLPDLLRQTELRLQERTEELERLQRQQMEYDRQLKDSRVQVEKQFEMEGQRRQLLLQNTDKEEALGHVNLQLQELTRENVELQRQLDATSATELRMFEQERQKTSAKDRAYRTQVLELETQINQARNEIARLKREKEEGERKLRSQVIEVQGKLDQSESSKRCLQNYLHFIQTSYATTFGDSITASTSARTLASPYTSCHRSPYL